MENDWAICNCLYCETIIEVPEDQRYIHRPAIMPASILRSRPVIERYRQIYEVIRATHEAYVFVWSQNRLNTFDEVGHEFFVPLSALLEATEQPTTTERFHEFLRNYRSDKSLPDDCDESFREIVDIFAAHEGDPEDTPLTDDITEMVFSAPGRFMKPAKRAKLQ